MQERIEEIIGSLSAPLTKGQIAAGWTDRSKKGLLPFFEKLLDDVRSAHPVAYIGIVRSLDTWGVDGGELYDRIIGLSAELNSKPR